MITPRSASKFDLFAQAGRHRQLEEVGDPLQVIAKHIDFNELAALVAPFLGRGDGSKGGRPAYPVDVMVRILVLKQLYNLSDEQMEYQLLDRMSYQRFCLLEHSLNVPDRNTIWRFGQLLGIDGATALFEGAELQLRRHGYIARGGQAIDATLVPAPKQRINKEERAQLQEGQTPDWSEAKSRQKDTDASFTKKHGKSYFGYKRECGLQARLYSRHRHKHGQRARRAPLRCSA